MTDWFPGPAWLFCPADRPDRYGKALHRADVVLVDLEDAVASSRKEQARDRLRELANSGELDIGRTVLRVNDAESHDHEEDLQLAHDLGIKRLMLAKAEHAERISAIPTDVIPLIETPRGVECAAALAEPDNVIGIMWGADDLVAAMGGTSSRRADGSYHDVARFARARALLAAKASGRFALDAVHMDISDTEGLRAQCDDASAVGFDGTVAIHPAQVPVIRTAHLPDTKRVDWARGVIAASVAVAGGVTTFEGRMVDGPIFKQAERILRLAERRADPAEESAQASGE